jgi:hypothetical protein
MEKASYHESLGSNGPRGAEKEEKVRKMTNDLAFRLRPNSMEKYSKSKTLVRTDRRLDIRMTAEELNSDKETVKIIVTANLNQWRIQIRRSGLAERYNSKLCTLPLDVTYRSEYATDLNIDVKMRKNCPEESE